MGVVLKLVSVEVMVGVVLIRGISLLQLLTDCWLCWMKKLFNIVAFKRGVFLPRPTTFGMYQLVSGLQLFLVISVCLQSSGSLSI